MIPVNLMAKTISSGLYAQLACGLPHGILPHRYKCTFSPPRFQGVDIEKGT